MYEIYCLILRRLPEASGSSSFIELKAWKKRIVSPVSNGFVRVFSFTVHEFNIHFVAMINCSFPRLGLFKQLRLKLKRETAGIFLE